ncbi:MAG: hypothetical protein ACKO96_25195 [Flammeovirgaceae bacterium]
MEEKISQKEIEQYSNAYSTLLTEDFFGKNEKITGPEILTFTDIKQVNLFIIRELQYNWKQEAFKLKSPYFNYQAEEVKVALLNVQNILSNHIAVGKNDFLVLLKSAVVRTLNLILAPYDYFSDVLDEHSTGYLTTASLKDEVKYLKINQAPLENLVKKLETKKAELITGKEAFALLDHILEEVNFAPEDIEPYLAQFSKRLAVNINDFFGEKMKTLGAEVKPKVKLEETKKTFESTLPERGHTTVADNLAKQKVSKLKDGLTINQKFMFTKILFKGDFEVFTDTIDHIDSLDTLSRALAYLGDTYPNWDRESEEYEEFLEVLTKRFS